VERVLGIAVDDPFVFKIPAPTAASIGDVSVNCTSNCACPFKGIPTKSTDWEALLP
jgi:hypothetical protein